MTAFRTFLWLLVAVCATVLAWQGLEANRGVEMAQKPFLVPQPLVDHNGRRVTSATFRGKPTAVFFGYTHCPDVCPTTLYALDGWLREADPEGTGINAYFVTVDPERDTPEIMKAYVTAVSKRVVGISGRPENIAALVEDFGIHVRKVPVDEANPDAGYLMDHSASLYLIGADGTFRSSIAFRESSETAIAKLRNMIGGKRES